MSQMLNIIKVSNVLYDMGKITHEEHNNYISYAIYECAGRNLNDAILLIKKLTKDNIITIL